MNFLVDTNVLSELMKSTPAPAVLAWFASQRHDSLFVSAVTQAEMTLGVHLLPKGRRRTALELSLAAMFEEDFARRILPFDSQATPKYAEIVSTRKRMGRPISQFDAQIAATAHAAGLGVATRNMADFEGCGLLVVNPWNVSN